jgi:hypothetical protein
MFKLLNVAFRLSYKLPIKKIYILDNFLKIADIFFDGLFEVFWYRACFPLNHPLDKGMAGNAKMRKVSRVCRRITGRLTPASAIESWGTGRIYRLIDFDSLYYEGQLFKHY